VYVRDWLMTVFGSIVVVALAIGAAIGAHSLVGEPETSPGNGTNVAEMSDDFCTLMDDLATYLADRGSLLSDQSVMDPTSQGGDGDVSAIHAFGQSILDYTATIVAYERHAAEIVDDASLAEAFTTDADAIEHQGELFGNAAVNATTAEDFVTELLTASFDPSEQDLAARAADAEATITAAASADCGVDLVFDSSSGTDANIDLDGTSPSDPAQAAQKDATSIGQILDTAFGEWQGGDPLPTVDLVDGYYSITASTAEGSTSTSSFAASSPDAAIADQVINGPIDWCVAVTVTGDTSATYRNSATNGVEEGTCAELAGT